MRCSKIILGLLALVVLCGAPTKAEMIYGEDTDNWEVALKDNASCAVFMNIKSTRGNAVLYHGKIIRSNENSDLFYLIYSSNTDTLAYTFIMPGYPSRLFTGLIKEWKSTGFTTQEGMHRSAASGDTVGGIFNISWTFRKGSIGSHGITSSPSSLGAHPAEDVSTSQISLDRTTYRPGQRIGMSLTIPENALPAGIVDAYVIAISPEGNFYSVNSVNEVVEGITPIVAGWTAAALNKTVLTSTIPHNASAGTWKWILKLTNPGSDPMKPSNTLLGLTADCTIAGTVLDADTSVIGALVPQTGALADLGASITAALQLAAADVNAYLAQKGSPDRVTLAMVNSAGNADTAATATKTLLQTECPSVIIGPATSDTTTSAMSAASGEDVLFISPSATSSALALPNDNLMRMVMDDSQQATATNALLTRDGITHIIFLVRVDSYTDPLTVGIQNAFTESGGTITGIFGYSPRDDVADVMPEIISSMASLTTDLNPEKTAVIFLTVGETIEVFAEASKYAALSHIRWYASDSLAQSSAILADSTAAAFAASVKLTAPLPSFAPTDYSTHLDAALTENGLTPRTYAHAYYDAFVLSALALTNNGLQDSNSLRTAVRDMTSVYTTGATGTISFDANDDRQSGSYDYWQVTTNESGARTWSKNLTWNTATKTFE